MTSNGTETTYRYGVGNLYYDNLDEALSALYRERQGTSSSCNIKIIPTTVWET